MAQKTESLKKKHSSTITTLVLLALLISLPFAIYFSQQSDQQMVTTVLYTVSLFNIAAIAWLS
ncbi:MAG: hypothetical protein K8R40_01355 [Anaerolineaceae bacterium]|nr:hypothetical protein [Anaerolineaceae bacterium]